MYYRFLNFTQSLMYLNLRICLAKPYLLENHLSIQHFLLRRSDQVSVFFFYKLSRLNSFYMLTVKHFLLSLNNFLAVFAVFPVF